MTVDLHSHIIFGIDDGSKSFDMTKELIDQAVSVGIKHIIATPHYNDYISDDFFDLRDDHCKQINKYTKDNGIELEVEAAAEVAFLSDWDRVLEEPRCFIRNKYVLVEFPDHSLPSYYLDVIFKIRQKGLTPIIAHPERCISVQRDMNIIHELIRMGTHFQCDAGSLLNHFGKETMKCATKMIEMNIYQFYGSDAHEPKHRNYKVLAEKPDITIHNESLLTDEHVPQVVIRSIEKPKILKKILDFFRD